MKKISDKLFSTTTSGFYIILFALSIGVATFIENDFGTSSAQNVIFKSWWFELILVLFAISLVVNIFRFRMLQQKKWAILTFHAAIIVILLGAGVTRYFGSEGMMHIRAGITSNSFLSSESYLQFEAIHDGKKYLFEEPAQFSTLGNNNFKKSYLIGNELVKIEVLDFMPNPKELLAEDKKGIPIIKIIMGGMNGREEYYLKYKDQVNIHGTLFNFDDPHEGQAFNIKYENDRLYFKTNNTYTQMQMATQKKDTLSPGIYHPLLLRSLYSGERQSFVIADFKSKGRIEVASSSEKMTSTSLAGLNIKIGIDGKEKNFYVYGSKGAEGKPRMISFGNTNFSVSYGSKSVQLPFSLKLNEFIMERYPGTNSASSYASEITLLDPRNNINRDQRIYMNHILNYGGYRFFQSSFDKDELGTYLSVNNDGWGTWISYIGYALLTLGMILTMFSDKSRFSQLAKNIKKLRQAGAVTASLLITCFISFSTSAYSISTAEQDIKAVDIKHATQFGRLIMQDHNGRLKPMNTFANELLRKISRKETIYGLKAEQVILSIAADSKNWYG
ncbi:MAG: cytochrome c biogenesis protein ResB, partial [Cyclobacteriaceae bacterium]|nr:cytochrome c biogenesis protein ResB [Cyclobacteriaceae bacterium]